MSPAAQDAALATLLRDYVQATERLQDTHATLQREVERLRQELASKDRELERKRRLAALGELAAGVAHEIRNPLGAIQLYSDLLRSELPEDASARDILNKLDAGVRAIDAIVQDTLALAPRRSDLEPRELAPILADARELCCEHLRRTRTEVRMTSPAEPIFVQAEPQGLRRVLTNLIVNAADASPAGSEVEVLTTAAPTHVTIRVRDRGSGISAELLDRIFDPFFTTKDFGTGLGLTIAHRLCEAYGGELTARNRRGGGAEFSLQLPRVWEPKSTDNNNIARPCGVA